MGSMVNKATYMNKKAKTNTKTHATVPTFKRYNSSTKAIAQVFEPTPPRDKGYVHTSATGNDALDALLYTGVTAGLVDSAEMTAEMASSMKSYEEVLTSKSTVGLLDILTASVIKDSTTDVPYTDRILTSTNPVATSDFYTTSIRSAEFVDRILDPLSHDTEGYFNRHVKHELYELKNYRLNWAGTRDLAASRLLMLIFYNVLSNLDLASAELEAFDLATKDPFKYREQKNVLSEKITHVLQIMSQVFTYNNIYDVLETLENLGIEVPEL